MWNTLLLTWCIKPKWKILSKKDDDLVFQKRLQQYNEAISYYIAKSDFHNIVFCDNSNFDFDVNWEMKKLAEKYNKFFEYITYDWNKESNLYGYWYSECEIVDFAFENSQYIKKSKSWYKITGRYILKDINKLIHLTSQADIYFHRQWIFDSPLTVSTSFFKISNSLYKELLYKKHIGLYKALEQKSYYKQFFLNWSIPVEKIWYILLRVFLINHKKNINYSVPVYYIFPSSLPKKLNNPFWELIRKIIYFLYYLFWIDILFSFHHRCYDVYYFKKIYKPLIKDKLIPW